MDTGIDEDLVAVFGESSNNIYALSSSGTIIQNTKQFVTSGPARSWRMAASLSGTGYAAMAARTYNDLFLVGRQGRIDNFDRRETSEMSSGTRVDLNSAWAGGSNAFAVGDRGVILRNSDPPLTAGCPINVRISVSAGDKPTISWSPPCRVSKIIFNRGLIYTDGNLIEPGVNFWDPPAHAVRFLPYDATPLVKGEVYELTLIRREANNERIIGTWNVVPEGPLAGGSARVFQTMSPGTGLAPEQASDYSGGFYLQRLIGAGPPYPGEPEQMLCFGINRYSDGLWRWYGDPALREDQLNIRPVLVLVPYQNAETGEVDIFVHDNIRAADIGGNTTVLWDFIDRE